MIYITTIQYHLENRQDPRRLVPLSFFLISSQVRVFICHCKLKDRSINQQLPLNFWAWMEFCIIYKSLRLNTSAAVNKCKC